MSRGENMLPWREHTDDPPSLDSLVLHFCSVSPWTSHCKRGQFAVSVIYRMLQSICWTKIACKHVCLCLLCPCIVGPFRAVSCAPKFLRVPDLFGLTSVVQKEEDVCILADAVVSEALQIDEEVVRHGDTAAVTMALSGAVTLGTKKKVTANKTGPYCHSACR